MNWLIDQIDYIYLWYGIAFCFLSGLCFTVSFEIKERATAWKCLGGFCFLRGLNKLLIVFRFLFDNLQYLKPICFFIGTTSFYLLFLFIAEFLKDRKNKALILFHLLTVVTIIVGFIKDKYCATVLYSFMAFPTLLYLVRNFNEITSVIKKENIKNLVFVLYSLIGYVFTEGYIFYASIYYNKSYFNGEIFETYGTSILVIFIYSVIFFLLASYIYVFAVMKPKIDKLYIKHIIIFIIVPILFVIGWLWCGHNTEKAKRALEHDLKQKSVLLSDMLLDANIGSLSFSEKDLEDFLYKRIHNQLLELKNFYRKIDCIYVLKCVQSKLLYGPISVTKDCSNYKQPGTNCDDFDEIIWKVLDDNINVIKGINKKNGKFLVAYAPITVNDTQFVACLEMSDYKFNKDINDVRFETIKQIFAIIVFLTFCYFTIDYRDRFGGVYLSVIPENFEVIVVFLLGVVFTISCAKSFELSAVFNSKRQFRKLSQSKYIIAEEAIARLYRIMNRVSLKFSELSNLPDNNSFSKVVESFSNIDNTCWIWAEDEISEKNEIKYLVKNIYSKMFVDNKVFNLDTDLCSYDGFKTLFKDELIDNYFYGTLISNQNGILHLALMKRFTKNSKHGYLIYLIKINKFLEKILQQDFINDGVIVKAIDDEDFGQYINNNDFDQNQYVKTNSYKIVFPMFICGKSLLLEFAPSKEYNIAGNAEFVSDLTLFSGYIFTVFFTALLVFLNYRRQITSEAVEREIQLSKEKIKDLLEENNKIKEQAENSEKLALKSATSNSEKSLFFANMSHEIRNSINGIISMNDMLLKTDLSSEQREYAKIISSSSDGLLYLINEILDFSKIEAGKMLFENLDFDLTDILNDVVNSVKNKAEQKGIYVKLEFDENIPPLLNGDFNKIRQVLLNLVGNAIKFTSKGGIRIVCECGCLNAAEVTVTFHVIDTGIGISESQKDLIFNYYSQASRSTKRLYGGTGLGLAISQKVIMCMGGKIEVVSEINKGSDFSFSLTLKRQSLSYVHKTIFELNKTMYE